MKNTTSIKDEELFQKVMNKGSWYGSDFLSGYILPNNDNFNLLGLGIGKKVGKAYKRNKVKRFIRSAYTKLEQDLKIGFNIVFIWKSKANYDNVSYDAIYNDLVKIFSKAGLL